MNIEIANRLVNLRKENGLSQEQLAEKIGVSRQAVSKWERSEASPDTDNIILLARLYNISLDELLRTDDEIPCAEETHSEPEYAEEEPVSDGFEQTPSEENGEPAAEEATDDNYFKESANGDKVHIGLDGIHVISHDGDNVHVSFRGIHVEENGGHRVHVSPAGVFVDDNEYTTEEWQEKIKKKTKFDTPIIVLSVIAFLSFGFTIGWHISWLFLLAVPILCTLETALRNKNPSDFAFPVLAALIFFSLGIQFHVWHPTWAIFLTIPIYYLICEKVKGKSVGAAIVPVIICVIYVLAGLFLNLWHPGWIIFITIPLFYWFFDVFKNHA